MRNHSRLIVFVTEAARPPRSVVVKMTLNIPLSMQGLDSSLYVQVMYIWSTYHMTVSGHENYKLGILLVAHNKLGLNRNLALLLGCGSPIR